MVPRVRARGLACDRDLSRLRAGGPLPSEQVASESRELSDISCSGGRGPRALDCGNPDLVIVDHMFVVALIETARSGRPSITVCNTCVWRALEMWRKFIAMLVGLRTEAGFEPIPADLESLWMVQDKMISTTLKSLDDIPGTLGNSQKLRHVGPVLERERHGLRIDLPAGRLLSVPLVLTSFSTMPEQGSIKKFQNAIDALSGLGVHGVVTVGDSVDPTALRPSPNVVVHATADHDGLMRRASLVLTHGGHGTFMRALQNGLPMVIIPGLGGDQPINAAAAEDRKVGRALPGDASADMMREAVAQVLGSSSYRERAAALSAQLAGIDGAGTAADEIEVLLSDQLRKAS